MSGSSKLKGKLEDLKKQHDRLMRESLLKDSYLIPRVRRYSVALNDLLIQITKDIARWEGRSNVEVTVNDFICDLKDYSNWIEGVLKEFQPDKICTPDQAKQYFDAGGTCLVPSEFVKETVL